MAAEQTAKVTRPRASEDDQMKALLAKLQKVMARKAKKESATKGCAEEVEDKGTKKEALAAIDAEIDALKKIRKLVRKI